MIFKSGKEGGSNQYIHVKLVKHILSTENNLEQIETFISIKKDHIASEL